MHAHLLTAKRSVRDKLQTFVEEKMCLVEMQPVFEPSHAINSLQVLFHLIFMRTRPKFISKK